MKILAIAALGCAWSSALAQSYRVDLAYGDSATAALNGKAVGEILNPNDVIRVGSIGSSATFQLWLSGNTGERHSGGAAFVGFDQVVAATNASFPSRALAEAAGRNKKLRISDKFFNFSNEIPSENAEHTPVLRTLAPAGGHSFRASREESTGLILRSIGLTVNYGVGTNTYISLREYRSFRLMDFSITNLSMGHGEIFGDSLDENGLTLNGSSIPTFFGGNQLSGTPRGAPNVKYKLQAVPEPGTILAISAGLAALARRRRKA